MVITPWTGATPAAQPCQDVRLQVDNRFLARSNTALVVEPRVKGRLTMGKTAHGSPAGELSNIFQRVRRDDEDPQLLTFIPMEVSMSPTHTPMRHSLQYMRPQYLRRTPANVFAYTAAYVPDTDGSHWRGF